MRDFNYFATMSPMKYYNNTDDTPKRRDILSNKDNLYIASVKHDGDWGMLIHWDKNTNLIRSRSISKVTGKYGDYTERLPQIVDEMNKLPDKTVILAELCYDIPGKTVNDVGTILRCLPKKAVERQKTAPLVAIAFDCLMWNGEDIFDSTYEYRLNLISKNLSILNSKSIYSTTIIESNFEENADQIISNGGEGLVIQLKSNPYMPDTRTAWKTLKLKESLPILELKVKSTVEPVKEYCGDLSEKWQYHDKDGNCVTKPYYMGWKNGIVVDYNGIDVNVASGLTDDDRAWLATDEAQSMISKGGLYAQIKAMQENSQKSLRHPYVVSLRRDVDGPKEN
jgi:hypothetical protein